jgi:hypothetical protein
MAFNMDVLYLTFNEIKTIILSKNGIHKQLQLTALVSTELDSLE